MNLYRRAELPLYLRYALSRGKVLSALQKLLFVMIDRKGNAGRIVYPLALPALLSEPVLPEVDRRVFSGLRKLSKSMEPVPASWEIPLAGRKLRLDIPAEWNMSFDDPEDAFALHRFGWILPCLAENGSSALAMFFARAAAHWIDQVTPDNNPLAWQTYNTSERIVNWIYLSAFLADAGESMPSESLVKESLHRQAVYVAKHLEYFGDDANDRTNNHMINNARALYLTGAFLQLPAMQETGRKILMTEFDRSFTSRGVLREGSSHYQLLLLSRVLEVLIAARNVGDQFLADKLNPLAGRLLGAARFFRDRPGESFPLIGDVSPDFTPDWFRDAVFWNEAEQGRGWLSLWPTREKLGFSDLANKGFQDFPTDGWFRFDGSDCRLFWRVQPEGRIPNYSHAHHDSGAFVMNLRDNPLFVDTGRSSYAAECFGLYGRSARSHNACMVDGHEPFVSDWLNGSRAMLNDYKDAKVEASAQPTDDTLIVSHDGFARLPGVGAFERKFHMREKGIMIEDSLKGRGKHLVDTYFHFAPDVDVQVGSESVELRLPGRSEKIMLNVESNGRQEIRIFRGEKNVEGAPLGWCSPRYGELVPATTVRFRQNSELPLSARFFVRWS